MSNEQKKKNYNINLLNFYAFILGYKNKNIGTWTLMQVAEDPGTGKLTTDKIYIDRFFGSDKFNSDIENKTSASGGSFRYSDHGKKVILNMNSYLCFD